MIRSCKAFICSLAGEVLEPGERDFIAKHNPWGFILFGRNIKDADQLCHLNESLRQISCQISGRKTIPIVVDQEGGKVRRLRPPLVADYPAAATLGELYKRDPQAGLRAAWLMSRLHAVDLRRFGFNVNCLPVLDILIATSHEAIGSRSFGDEVQLVTLMGEQAAQGLLAGGVLPVMKHIPGQGRALSDTHFDMAHIDAPLEVLRKNDFMPYHILHHLPAAMNSHVIYDAVDRHHPATFSHTLVHEIIRGEIGFDGLLMSDDIGMNALNGSFEQRAQKCFAAGFDLVLHCSGDMAQMIEIAKVAPLVEGKVARRSEAALECIIDTVDEGDEPAWREEFAELLVRGEA